MTNIKQSAVKYESPKTLNITELKSISVDVEIFEKNGTKENGETFVYKAINVSGKEYRFPVSVLKQLQEHLKENPNLKFFKVNKTGGGLGTEYITIPLK
jgi:hypothetical protein